MNIIKTSIIDPGTDVFWAGPSLQDTAEVTERPILVLVNEYADGSNEEAQLLKMLDACGLKGEQYHILQVAKDQKTAWHQLRERHQPKVVFLIGVMPAQLGITAMFQLHTPNNFNDRVWLPTLSLSELEQQPAVKKQLWMNGMKPVFVDKVIGNW